MQKRHVGNFRVFQLELEATRNLGGELGMLQHIAGRPPIQPWSWNVFLLLYQAEKY